MVFRRLSQAATALACAVACLLFAQGLALVSQARSKAASHPATMTPSAMTANIDVADKAMVRFDSARVSYAWASLLAAARYRGMWDGKVNGPLSGVRTYAEQAKLWHEFLAGRGAPAFAPDGPSRHMKANYAPLGPWAHAVDVSRPRQLIAAAKRLGVNLWQPYAGEPWHVEAAEHFGSADLP